MPAEMRLVEIISRSDDILLPWLDLYETAFPGVERVLVSHLLEGVGSGETRRHMLAALDGQDKLGAMLYYSDQPEAQAAFLWYFAVIPELRGQGWGARLYGELLQRLKAGERALFFDVERPDDAGSPALRENAERRMRFYRRLGAVRLAGVRYVQRAGPHLPELPMHLMVHPLGPLNAQEAYEMGRSFLPEALSQSGTLRLE